MHPRSHQPVAHDVVARALGVSTSRGSHIATQLFGKSWRELLVDECVERAKRLLRREGLSVRQVATLCGYEDPNTFGRIFRKRTGLSPGRWRKPRKRTS